MKSQAKKDKEFWNMVADCVRNSNARRKDKRRHSQWKKEYIAATRLDDRNIASVSNNIAGQCFKHDVADARWKRTYDDADLVERERLAQVEVDKKKSRIAVAYNKGPYMVITDPKDVPTLGREV